MIPHLAQMSIELLVLTGVVCGVIALFRINKPAIRHLFLILILLKPMVTVLIASPITPYSLFPSAAKALEQAN